MLYVTPGGDHAPAFIISPGHMHTWHVAPAFTVSREKEQQLDIHCPWALHSPSSWGSPQKMKLMPRKHIVFVPQTRSRQQDAPNREQLTPSRSQGLPGSTQNCCKCSIHSTPYLTVVMLVLLCSAIKDEHAGIAYADVTAALPPVDPLSRFLASDRVHARPSFVSEASAPQCCYMVHPRSCF